MTHHTTGPHASVGATRYYASTPVRQGGDGFRDAEPEPCEYDVTGGLPEYVTLPRPKSIETCPEWGDQELGVIARSLLEGRSVASITADLGLESTEPVRALVLALGDALLGRRAGGTRGMPEADRAQVRHMRYDQKLTAPEISRRTGHSESRIRYVLSLDGGGD
jgi:hypothetical protein